MNGTKVESDVLAFSGPSAKNPLLICDEARAEGQAPALDDFEDGDLRVLDEENRNGNWFYYGDGSPGGVTTLRIQPVDHGRALHVTSSGFTDFGSGFGMTFSWPQGDSERYCAYDASVYGGVRFRARGNTRARLVLQTRSDKPTFEGGLCERGENCYDQPGVPVPLSTEWQEFTIPFCQLRREGWGGNAEPLDASQLYALTFRLSAYRDADVWLDDVRFVHSAADAGTEVCAICPLKDLGTDIAFEPAEWALFSPPSGAALYTFEQTTPHCGMISRRYIAFVPKGLKANSDAPLVLVFHGHGGSAESQRDFQMHGRLDQLAQRDGFIAVYANAAPGEASTADLPNSGAWRQSVNDDGQVDDFAYIDLLLGDLKTRGVTSGENPLHLIGHSNGGGLVYEAATRNPNRYAGVAAMMPFAGFEPPAPPKQLAESSLRRLFFGYAPGDPGLPPDYTAVLEPLWPAWARAAGLPELVVKRPLEKQLPNPVDEGADYAGTEAVLQATMSSSVTQLDYAAPESAVQVRVQRYHGAGHFWPTAEQDTLQQVLSRWGFRNQDVDASDEIWDFFKSGR